MKGLFLTHVDKSAEGYELVKRGVRNDLRSHIVWHVYGLMHRADRNYEEALKCYVQANRIEKVRPDPAAGPCSLIPGLGQHPHRPRHPLRPSPPVWLLCSLAPIDPAYPASPAT